MNHQQPTPAKKKLTAIGLMSGTSLDGIDAAVIETDGEKIFSYGKFITIPYDDKFRDELREAINKAREMPEGRESKDLGNNQLAYELTKRHAEAIKQLGVKADIIGFHGQTLLHRPDQKFTWQLGNGELLSELTGIPVVSDFRTADVAAGGQGAPLVPVFHKAVVENIEKPVAIVNIGGVANVTLIGENDELLAFDTGPGNAMINDIMKRHFNREYDDNGEVAAKGTVDIDILVEYLKNDYLKKAPPKSLDRNHFNLDLVKNLSPEDAVATLTTFTACAILKSRDFIKSPIKTFYIAGGGRHNKRLMQTLGENALPVEAIGENGDAFEAQAFGFLAVRVKYGLPITFPSTTGLNLDKYNYFKAAKISS